MTPIPGKNYTVQDGDSLSRIATRAYGDPTLWPRIWEANQTRLRSGDPDIIFPGEVILIPVLAERRRPPAVTTGKDPGGMFVNLGGQEIAPLSGRIIRTLDTVANAYSASIPWTPGVDEKLDQQIAPYSYTPILASIGDQVIVTGVNYGVSTSLEQGSVAEIKGATTTIDIVDSKLRPPFEFADITLDDLIKRLIEPHGFSVIIEADTGGAFQRVTATSGDTIFSFLNKLARQRGVLLTCDIEGNLVVTRAVIDSPPVATLEENVTPGVRGWQSNFDGRKRFNTYRAVGRSPSGDQEGVVTDNKVPRSRFITISADDSVSGDIEGAAQWMRNKILVEAMTFNLTVNDWYDPQGDLWKENTIVSVISPSMFFPDGFNLLVNRVEYILDGAGRSTVLSLLPPTVYTQGEIIEPW